MTNRNRRSSLQFLKLDSEVSSISSNPTETSNNGSPERPKRRDMDANHVVGDDELWADFQQRLRQSKHNVTAADTRRMFQEFILEKKQKAAVLDAAEQHSSNGGDSDSPTGIGESSAEAQRTNSTASSAKNFFRRMSMASSVHGGGSSVRSINSSGHTSGQVAAGEDEDDQSRRSSLGSLGSLGALYSNIVGELADSEDDDSDDEDLLGRMVGNLSSSPGRLVDTLSTSPGRLGVLQKLSSDRQESSNIAAKEEQSNRCIYQMAQEVGNANSSSGAPAAQSKTLEGQRARQGRRGSIADRLAQVAALAKVSLEGEIYGEEDHQDNDGHGAYSGLR